MSLLAWIVMGALAGWIASMIVRTSADMGAFANIIVGIVGAVLGGWIVQAFGAKGVTGFDFYSLLVSILGAVILLALVNFFRRGSAQA